MKILNTLQERHRYNVVHPRWDMSTLKLPVLYNYTVQQNEGIQPATNMLHFLFSLSQSLSHNYRIDFHNATIHYTVVLQFLPFIEGIPWENT